MSIDLEDFFRDSGLDLPPSTVNVDKAIRRGRRRGALRLASTVAVTVVGLAIVCGGALTLKPDTSDRGAGLGLSALAGSATPSGALPSVTVYQAPKGSTPAALLQVKLPDPAPGFPVRLEKDQVAPAASATGGYFLSGFWVAKNPAIKTYSGTVDRYAPAAGPEATVQVSTQAALVPDSAGRIENHPVIETVVVSGTTGYLIRYRNAGDQSTYTDLYFFKGGFRVLVEGWNNTTSGELIALGNSLTGL